MIQCSQATAKLLLNAGKGNWLQQRENSVFAKGKGTLATYWIAQNDMATSPDWNGSESHFSISLSCIGGSVTESGDIIASDKRGRLIDWLTKIIVDRIRPMIARRQALGLKPADSPEDLVYYTQEGKTCLDEVKEFIELPKFVANLSENVTNAVKVAFSVRRQIREYVLEVANMYHDNPFHNFEHAAHVTMA